MVCCRKQNSAILSYILILTDGSFIKTGTSSEAISDDLSISVSLRLYVSRTVFLAEIYIL